MFVPWYGTVDVARYRVKLERRVPMHYGGTRIWARVGRTDVLGVPLYLVGHRQITREMYGGKRDRYGWLDEHKRFRFFSAALAAVIASSDWQPDVLHLNDFHSALVPMFLGEQRPPVVLSIHNGRFQGSFRDWPGLPDRWRDADDVPLPPLHTNRARFVNFLRRGIHSADLIVPVSPTYARELARPDHLDELGDILPVDRTVGIVNGIDTEQLDPKRDRVLPRRYDASTLDHRAVNKRFLQRALGFAESATTPLLALVARLDPQKGVDLVLHILLQLVERDVQVAITGDGGPKMRGLIEEMAAAAPSVLVYRPFAREDETLYYGGADIALVPSRYEPCGLVQLKAMRYGAVPIVQRVGGLADTVVDHDPPRQRGTGFVFDRDHPLELLRTIDRAIEVYRRPVEWRAIQRRCMALDLGWDAPAKRYVAAYRQAMRIAPTRRP